MKDMSPKDFCDRFSVCPEGREFAMEYDSMYRCYEGLLKGEADYHSFEWAWWTILLCYGGSRIYTKAAKSLFTRILQVLRPIVGDEKIDKAEKYVQGLGDNSDNRCCPFVAPSAIFVYEGPILDTVWHEADVALYRYVSKYGYGTGISCLRACAWKALADKYPDGIVCDVSSDCEDANEIAISTPGVPNPWMETFITPEVQAPFLAILREIGNPFEKEEV